MSIGYEVKNSTEAKRILLNAFNDGRLVSLTCSEAEIGRCIIEKLYINVVRVSNVVIKYDSIREITVHRKINFTDKVVRYLQEDRL